MNKLKALYINEMVKVSKKISVIIILSLMVIVIFGFGGMMKLQETMNPNMRNDYTEHRIQSQKDNINNQLQRNKTQLSEIEASIAVAEGIQLANLKEEEQMIQDQIDKIEYAIENDILLYSNSYRAKAVNKLFSYKRTVSQLSSIPDEAMTDEQKAILTNAKSSIDTLQEVIKSEDFEKFISFSNDEIKKNESMSDELKNIQIESNELRLKYDLKGELGSDDDIYGSVNNYIYRIERAKHSLIDNVDYTGNMQNQQPLTEDRSKEIKNDIAVMEHQLKKGIGSINSPMGMDAKSFVMPAMLGIGTFMTVILVMILAGATISHEITSGSIKSLIISPVKRWKIFTSKVMALLTVGIVTALIAYIIAVAANGVFFGFNSGSPYIYAVNGVAHELNFYIYQLIRVFVDHISVIVFMTFALMLSTVTRNTAASVGISIAVFFVGSNANRILMQFVQGEWTRFIPFNNLDFSVKLFPNENLSQISNNIGNTVSNSLTFSLIYVIVLVICMGYTALDSFNRRDIK